MFVNNFEFGLDEAFDSLFFGIGNEGFAENVFEGWENFADFDIAEIKFIGFVGGQGKVEEFE